MPEDKAQKELEAAKSIQLDDQRQKELWAEIVAKYHEQDVDSSPSGNDTLFLRRKFRVDRRRAFTGFATLGTAAVVLSGAFALLDPHSPLHHLSGLNLGGLSASSTNTTETSSNTKSVPPGTGLQFGQPAEVVTKNWRVVIYKSLLRAPAPYYQVQLFYTGSKPIAASNLSLSYGKAEIHGGAETVKPGSKVTQLGADYTKGIQTAPPLKLSWVENGQKQHVTIRLANAKADLHVMGRYVYEGGTKHWNMRYVYETIAGSGFRDAVGKMQLTYKDGTAEGPLQYVIHSTAGTIHGSLTSVGQLVQMNVKPSDNRWSIRDPKAEVQLWWGAKNKTSGSYEQLTLKRLTPAIAEVAAYPRPTAIAGIRSGAQDSVTAFPTDPGKFDRQLFTWLQQAVPVANPLPQSAQSTKVYLMKSVFQPTTLFLQDEKGRNISIQPAYYAMNANGGGPIHDIKNVVAYKLMDTGQVFYLKSPELYAWLRNVKSEHTWQSEFYTQRENQAFAAFIHSGQGRQFADMYPEVTGTSAYAIARGGPVVPSTQANQAILGTLTTETHSSGKNFNIRFIETWGNGRQQHIWNFTVDTQGHVLSSKDSGSFPPQLEK